MRVLHTRTQQFVDLPTGEKYAILSHTWGDEEVTFQEMSDPAAARRKRGFQKIEGLCSKALQDGYTYCWADQCCINKESSAELGEAINSMYQWYEEADVCYALLTDVEATSTSVGPLEEQLTKSRWFTRGWTLQELLAPKNVILFDKNWNMLGTKASMMEFLAKLTRIDEAVLSGRVPLSRRSIAQRMSWAAGRVTTRIEDTAYCLLGIFDVHMPMIYGEGKRAFLRLQLQIIEQSDDHSIFAWPIGGTGNQGMLADSPSAFRNSHGIVSFTSRRGRPPYRMTNRGLSLELPALPFAMDTYLVQLDCYEIIGATDTSSYPHQHKGGDVVALGIFLRRLEEDDQYARVENEGSTFQTVSLRTPRTRIKVNIRQRMNDALWPYRQNCLNGFRVDGTNLFPPSLHPRNNFVWDKLERTITAKAGEGFSDVGHLETNVGKIKVIKLGFDSEFNPVCFLAASRGMRETEPGMFALKHNQYQLTEGIRPTAEGTMQRRGLFQRHASDTLGWSDLRNGKAVDLQWHDGLWAVKGDRIHGLDIVLENSGGMLSGKDVRLRITRDEPENGSQWRVRLDMQ